MFRGREVTHPQLGRKILDDIAERVDAIGKVEAYPRLDGRNMTMVLAPDRKKQQSRQSKSARTESSATAAPPAEVPADTEGPADTATPSANEPAATQE
jgi:translation initiation factor IF-3